MCAEEGQPPLASPTPRPSVATYAEAEERGFELYKAGARDVSALVGVEIPFERGGAIAAPALAVPCSKAIPTQLAAHLGQFEQIEPMPRHPASRDILLGHFECGGHAACSVHGRAHE
eukprot:1826630-Pleurochrysis_carterae.AAC.2